MGGTTSRTRARCASGRAGSEHSAGGWPVTRVLIRPHAGPRDARDAFIAVIALLLIAASALLGGYLLLRIALDPWQAATGALGLAAVLLVAIGLHAVPAIEMDDAGITFRRLIGAPRFLTWETITSIRRAERAEVVLRGWLLPPIPPRGASLSLTSLGHYRIDWNRGSCYFPPADESLFLEQLERHWGGLL